MFIPDPLAQEHPGKENLELSKTASSWEKSTKSGQEMKEVKVNPG